MRQTNPHPQQRRGASKQRAASMSMALMPGYVVNGSSVMSGLSNVSSDHHRSFVDPEGYQASIRGGDSLYSVLARGTFHAELTDVTVGALKLQRGRKSLPRLAASGMPADKVGILAWFGVGRLPVVRGVQISPGEMLSLGPGMQSHHRTSGPNEFVALTLDASELNRAANELTGRDLTPAAGSFCGHPFICSPGCFPSSMPRPALAKPHPEIFSSSQASRALEQALLQPMIECLCVERHARKPARAAAARLWRNASKRRSKPTSTSRYPFLTFIGRSAYPNGLCAIFARSNWECRQCASWLCAVCIWRAWRCCEPTTTPQRSRR